MTPIPNGSLARLAERHSRQWTRHREQTQDAHVWEFYKEFKTCPDCGSRAEISVDRTGYAEATCSGCDWYTEQDLSDDNSAEARY